MKKKMIIIASVILALALAVLLVFQHPAFGSLPKGDRLEKIKQSKNYREGKFQNMEETPMSTGESSMVVQLWDFLFKKHPNKIPDDSVPAVKTDLANLDLTKNQMIWFGHSSYLMVVNGKKILVDPVLTSEFPASLMMQPFKGSALYSPEDLPEIDYLFISHDHWDHLDYATLKRIKDKVKNAVIPLGVGAHLEKWGYGDKITELDWNDEKSFEDLKVTCLTARHFSGRMLVFGSAQSLWASYMLEIGGKFIYIGGDSGYGKHFAEIGKRFPQIDIAILENGQYDKDWALIHTMPEELPRAIRDLHAEKVIPVHNGKFALANHPWDEPSRLIQEANQKDSTLHVENPTIGKWVMLQL